MAVPPGSAHVTTACPSARNHSASNRLWVDLPVPSRPSRVRNRPDFITIYWVRPPGFHASNFPKKRFEGVYSTGARVCNSLSGRANSIQSDGSWRFLVLWAIAGRRSVGYPGFRTTVSLQLQEERLMFLRIILASSLVAMLGLAV